MYDFIGVKNLRRPVLLCRSFPTEIEA